MREPSERERERERKSEKERERERERDRAQETDRGRNACSQGAVLCQKEVACFDTHWRTRTVALLGWSYTLSMTMHGLNMFI